MRIRKKGVDYIRERTLGAIERQEPITPSVLRVQDKLESISRSSMLKGALASNRLYDLSIAEARRKPKKDVNKVV